MEVNDFKVERSLATQPSREPRDFHGHCPDSNNKREALQMIRRSALRRILVACYFIDSAMNYITKESKYFCSSPYDTLSVNQRGLAVQKP